MNQTSHFHIKTNLVAAGDLSVQVPMGGGCQFLQEGICMACHQNTEGAPRQRQIETFLHILFPIYTENAYINVNIILITMYYISNMP